MRHSCNTNGNFSLFQLSALEGQQRQECKIYYGETIAETYRQNALKLPAAEIQFTINH